MVLRAFSMEVLSQAEDEGQRVHEKAAETWRDSPGPFSRFGSRDCCWLTLYIPLQHKSYIYQAVHRFSCPRPLVFLLYPCISPIKFCSRHISLGLAACVRICSVPYGMLYQISFFIAISLCMHQSGIPSPKSRGVLCQTG